MLAVHGDGCQSGNIREVARPARACTIAQRFPFFHAAYPSADGLGVTSGEYGNSTRVGVLHAQRRHGGPLFNLLLNEKASCRCIERLGKGRQSVLHAQEYIAEVFFTAATSSGSDFLILPNPISAR